MKQKNRDIGRKVAEAKPFKCKDCGEIFVMDRDEMDWYSQKMGWPLPGRCKACRRRRKEGKA